MPMSRRLGVRSNSVPVTREEAAESPPNPDEAPPSDRREAAVGWATWVGLALALVGLIDGLMMALKRKVAACPDGKYFPEGTTDFTCYAHPQAGLGIAIAALSVVLGILIVLCSMVASQSGGPSTIRLTGKDRVAPSRIRPHMAADSAAVRRNDDRLRAESRGCSDSVDPEAEWVASRTGTNGEHLIPVGVVGWSRCGLKLTPSELDGQPIGLLQVVHMQVDVHLLLLGAGRPIRWHVARGQLHAHDPFAVDHDAVPVLVAMHSATQ